MRMSEASWRTSLQLHRVSVLLWGHVLDNKLQALRRAVKANFDPNQPRVPAGNPDGGQWTDVDGSSGGGGGQRTSLGRENRYPRSSVVLASFRPGAQDDQPPKVPKEKPGSSRGRTRVYKELAKWIARGVLREVVGRRMTSLFTILDEAGWLEPAIDSIRTFADPPKSLKELQQDAYTPAPGYDVHHIVEQTSAERDGFPRSMIDAPENLVRVPRLKHWMITSWYMIPNEDYGWMPPRQYLRGKDWEERIRVGYEALIEAGVLRP